MIYYLGAFALTAGGAAVGLVCFVEGIRASSRAAAIAGALLLMVGTPLMAICAWKLVGESSRTVIITPTMGAVLVAPPRSI